MRTSSLIAIAALANRVIVNEAPLPGYIVRTVQWDVEVFAGRTETLNGTVEEVIDQILEINPAYKLNFLKAHEPRNPHHQRSNVKCGTHQLASKDRIEEGIKYLRNLQGAPRNGHGPLSCGRVSCSHGAAIWWCNDGNGPKVLDGWEELANSAQSILFTCAPVASMLSGQSFEDGDWNTIVRGDNC